MLVKPVQEKEPSVLLCALCVCVCFSAYIFGAHFCTDTVSGLVPSAVVIVSRAQ